MKTATAPRRGDILRYWVSAGHKVRGGWQLNAVMIDIQTGCEVSLFVEEFSTKKEAISAKNLGNISIKEARSL